MLEYDNKMPYQPRERNSYDSKASYDTDSACSSDDEKSMPPPYGLVFYSKLQNKPLPALPTGGTQKRVRFALEKPLPPLPDQHKPKRSSASILGEYAWWAQSRYNISDDLEDSMEKKID